MGSKKSRSRRGLIAATVIVVVSAVVGAVIMMPGAFRSIGFWVDGGSPMIASTVFPPPPASDWPPAQGLVGPPEGVKSQASANGAVLGKRIAALPSDGIGAAAWTVMDANKALLAQNGATSLMMPASTLKLLTGLVALESMPIDKTFSTRVVRPAPGSIILVGGGDPLLVSESSPESYPRPPSLAELAAKTAIELKKLNEISVSLGFDESAFTGPSWQPSWEPVFETDVTGISALIVDVGVDQVTKQRTKTPAASAAEIFARYLAAEGISVVGPPGDALASGTELARVDSLPLHVLVQQALMRSDNTVTEMILRQVAISSGKEPSFVGGTASLKQHLTKLGIWQEGAAVFDGSGVSRSNRISPAMLAGAVQLILHEPRYRVLLDALPVAGATGTLRDRFGEPTALSGRGWVRGKTGSLRDVSALAGLARSADGQNLILVFMANSVTNGWQAKVWIDAASALVAECGCR